LTHYNVKIKIIVYKNLSFCIFGSQEFSHRNGRTARMNSEGTAYILKWEKEELPDFIRDTKIEGIKIEALYFNSFIPLVT